MGMILQGAGVEFSASVFDWGQILRLAQAYGWQPAGTVIDEGDLCNFPNGRWDGGYQTNDYQRVTADDARNIANALDRALNDLPEQDVLANIRD
jgi:hypothetical protein